MKKTLVLLAIAALSHAFAQEGAGVYEVLARDTVYVHPSASKFLDVAQINRTAAEIRPTTLKVLVVPSLGSKWVTGGSERRGSFAKYVFEDKLSLKNGIVVVFTKQGLAGYSDRLSESALAKLNNEAVAHTKPNDFTTPIVWLAKSIHSSAAETQTRRAVGTGTIAAVAIGGLAVAGLVVLAGKKAKLAAARGKLAPQRHAALDAITYLDGYLDLLPAGKDLDALRQYRERAYTQYEEGVRILNEAKKPEEVAPSGGYFQAAMEDAAQGKKHIEAATGGTNVAYTIPPRVDPGAPPVQTAPAYQPYEDVCYFCSKPGEGDLTPVTMNLDGQRRTVLVCEDDLAEMERGGEPQMRGQYMGGQFVPWYMVRGYNPRSDFGSGSFLWDMMAINGLMHMFNPFGSHHTINNYYSGTDAASQGYDSGWSGQGDQGLSDFDQSGDFGGGGWGDSGGGDFGGGDFGGGDFGGGD